MPRPCDHATGEAQPGECRVCWHYVNTPGYKALWDGALFSPGANHDGRLCLYFGPLLREDACGTCNPAIRVRVKVYECSHPDRGETKLSGCTSCAYYADAPTAAEL